MHGQAGEWAASSAALAQALPLFGMLAPPDASPSDTSFFEGPLEAGGASLELELRPELRPELRQEIVSEIPEMNLGRVSAMAAAAARGWPVCLEMVLSSLVDAGAHLCTS